MSDRILTEDEKQERLGRVKSIDEEVVAALARVQHYLANLQSVRETEPTGSGINPPTPWPDDFSIDACLNHGDDTDNANAELNESDLRLLVSALAQMPVGMRRLPASHPSEVEVPEATPEERFVVITYVDGERVAAQRIADPFLLHTLVLTDDESGEETRVEVRIDAERGITHQVMNMISIMANEPILNPVPSGAHSLSGYAQVEVVQNRSRS